MSRRATLVPHERIERAIIVLRGLTLYGVTTGNLNKAVGRNSDRFPEDFSWQFASEEFRDLKFHFGTSSWGGTRKSPRVFTEQGVAMLSSVLASLNPIKVKYNLTAYRPAMVFRFLESLQSGRAVALQRLTEDVNKAIADNERFSRIESEWRAYRSDELGTFLTANATAIAPLGTFSREDAVFTRK